MTSFVPGTKLVTYDKSGAWHKTCHKCKIWCRDPNKVCLDKIRYDIIKLCKKKFNFHIEVGELNDWQ